MNRLVGFGCSHMFGAELTGRHVMAAEEHNHINLASGVARELGLLYVNAARVNNVNESIVEDVYETIRPGDTILVGWTYTTRREYLHNGNNDSPNSALLTPNIYEVLARKVGYDEFPSVTPELLIEIIRKNNQFVKNAPLELAEALAREYVEIRSHTFARLHELLRCYVAVRDHCAANDVTAYQFFFDVEHDIISMLNNNNKMMFTPYTDSKLKSNIDGQRCAKLRHAHFNKSSLIKHINNDPNFFRFDRKFSTLRRAVCERNGWDHTTWPDDLSHFNQEGNNTARDIILENIRALQ